jgi:hypothetical protein
MRPLYPDHGEQLIHRDLPSFAVAHYRQEPHPIDTTKSPGSSTDLVPGSSLKEGFVTLVSKLCVSGFRRICLCNQEISVGKRILCFLACGRFNGLFSNPLRLVQALRFHPLAKSLPPGRGISRPCHCSRVQEFSENTKRFGKKNDLMLAEKIQGRSAQISVRIHRPMRRVMTSMMRRGPQ